MNDSDFASYESLNKMDIHNLRIQLQAKSAFYVQNSLKLRLIPLSRANGMNGKVLTNLH